MTFAKKLEAHALAVNNFLAEQLATDPKGPPAPFRLGEAMRYGTLDGGKRFRPFLVMETSALFDVDPTHALRAAAAVECIHCYSLIHDDMPSMDDDDLRRGRPTVHKAFDEASAVLAGDALQSLAFEILAAPETHPDGAVRADLIGKLAKASGWHGMAGGQDMDLTAVDHNLSRAQIEILQQMKTGALIGWSCEAGGLLGGASDDERQALLTYAQALGLSFQIADDLLDLEGTAEETGKGVGKDADAGKATLLGALGVDAARELLATLEQDAISSLSGFGDKAETLIEAARFVVHRKH